MPGFIAHIGNSNINFAEEKRKKLVVNSITTKNYQVERRVVNKFMNDRLFADLDDYLVVVEGVVLNNHELIEQYQNQFNVSDYLLNTKNIGLFVSKQKVRPVVWGRLKWQMDWTGCIMESPHYV